MRVFRGSVLGRGQRSSSPSSSSTDVVPMRAESKSAPAPPARSLFGLGLDFLVHLVHFLRPVVSPQR